MITYMCTKCLHNAQKSLQMYKLFAYESGHNSGLGASDKKSLQTHKMDVVGRYT